MSTLYSHDDVVTSITLSQQYKSRFITTSLDGIIKLYDLLNGGEVLEELHTEPVLDSVFHRGAFYVSCVDGTVRWVDFESGLASVVGDTVHLKGANCLVQTDELLISGSWDKTVHLLDRAHDHTEIIEVPEKVVAMDVLNSSLVVAMTNRLIHVYDLDNLTKPVQVRESGLQYQIRCVSCFPEGFALSSIEGKLSMEFYDISKNYAFRCHRDEDKVNSVNCCLVTNSSHLFTSGDDGDIVMWDYQLKKKLRTYSFKPNKISKFVILNDSLIFAMDNKVCLKSL